MIWFHLHQDTPQDWKSHSGLEDWVPVYKEILVRRFESVYNKMDDEEKHSTFSEIASVWRGGTTDDAPVISGWISSGLSTLTSANIRRKFLVHIYCREINWAYDFPTISCVLDWGIDSLNVNDSKIIFNEETVRFLLLHRCFLRKYLAW